MTAPTVSNPASLAAAGAVGASSLASYEAAVSQVRAQVLLYAAAIWANTSLSDASVAALVAVFAPAVEAAQLQVANLTSVFLAGRTGTAPSPVLPDVVSRRGVPPEVVYARPVITARTLVSQGKPFDVAMDAGFRRLESIAATDVQLAKTLQADRSLLDAEVTFYRRVPKGTETCAMCLIASTQRYQTGKLLPIHNGCDCGVDVYNDDAETDLDALLEATHAKVQEFTEIADRGGREVDYRKLLITHEHGELGQVLGWHDQKFTGPNDIPKAKRRSVFDDASSELRRRDDERGPNAPTMVGAGSSRTDVNDQLAELLAGIEDV